MNVGWHTTRALILAILLLHLTAALQGCNTFNRLGEIFESTRETTLKLDRKWDIHEEGREFLIVMVHGFNSSSDEAWGKFPSLIVEERNSKFARFNLFRYGYDSTVCRNRVEISILGDGLRSFLIDEFKNYHGVIFVAHSMGGLVVMQASTLLARGGNSDLDRLPLIVMTFGTPHLGVEDADKLGHLAPICTDKQAEAMEAFSESLSNITANWNLFFRKHERNHFNYHVTMKKYYGPLDRFVSHASACGGDIDDCEQVDGNHAMIVKPSGSDHRSYQKLLTQISKLVSISDGMRPMTPTGIRIN